MTKDELIERLRQFSDESDDRDAVADHETADRLLLAFIDDPEVTKAFHAFDKHYE